MKASWDKLEQNWMQFEIEVEADQFSKAIGAAFKKLNQKVNIPGFRRGKAPRPIFERMYGKQALVQEAVEDLLPLVYSNAVTESNINPIDQPEIEMVQSDEGMPFIFKGKVQVTPEVTLGKIEGFELNRAADEVTEAQIEEQLNSLRDRAATLVPDESGVVANGSFVVVDFEGFVDDKPFDGGQSENYTLEVGSNSFIPGFEEQLIGAKLGDSLNVNVNFPEEYHAEHLAGKPALFKVTIKELKKKELPELNDEFAAETSRFSTVAELRTDIENRLKESAKASADRDFQNSVLEAVANEATVELPEVLVDRRIHDMIHDFQHSLEQQGYSIELWHQATGKTHEDLHKEFAEAAKKNVKQDLVVGAVAKQKNLAISEADLEVEFDEMLVQHKTQENDIKKLRKNPNYREKLREALLVQKTIDHLLQLNTSSQS
jgi:trigger factor